MNYLGVALVYPCWRGDYNSRNSLIPVYPFRMCGIMSYAG